MNQTLSEQFERDCDAALSWIARFRAEDASEEDHRAFALWLAADAGHRQAMDLMLELWDDLGSVRHLPFDEPHPMPELAQTLAGGCGRSCRQHYVCGVFAAVRY